MYSKTDNTFDKKIENCDLKFSEYNKNWTCGSCKNFTYKNEYTKCKYLFVCPIRNPEKEREYREAEKAEHWYFI
jgi:hypothetical protein